MSVSCIRKAGVVCVMSCIAVDVACPKAATLHIKARVTAPQFWGMLQLLLVHLMRGRVQYNYTAVRHEIFWVDTDPTLTGKLS